jgi:hypothetical protein
MAQPITASELETLVSDLQSDSAKRRWSTITRLAKLEVTDERVAALLEEMATQDPQQYVREEAQKVVSQPAYQELLRRQRAQAEERRAVEQAERDAQLAAQQAATSLPTQCPNCGYENPPGVKFCQNCGNSMTSKCRRCGTPNTLGVVFCGNCGVKLTEATFGLPADEVENWREAFGTLGWYQEMGPRTKQLLGQLEPRLDTNKEKLLFVTYGEARNYIQDVLLDGTAVRRGNFGVIGTDWRWVIVDTDRMQIHSLPYGDITGVDKPGLGGVMKEIRYNVRYRSGRNVTWVVRIDAPGMFGVIAGFGNPHTASHVLNHKAHAQEVIEFLNLYFARIVPEAF